MCDANVAEKDHDTHLLNCRCCRYRWRIDLHLCAGLVWHMSFNCVPFHDIFAAKLLSGLTKRQLYWRYFWLDFLSWFFGSNFSVDISM